MYKTRIDILKLIPKESVVAELGVFIGEYSQNIINVVNPSKLYMVDIFGKGKAHSMGIQVSDLSKYYDILTNKYINNNNICVVKSTTTKFLQSLPLDSLDAVYIDAEHSYRAVSDDLNNSYDKVKLGGYIMGHDYDRPEIQKAVNEFCVKYELNVLHTTEDSPPSFVIKK